MRTIITFLGKRPTLTSYSFQGHVIKGEVFAKALRGFVNYDRMLVFTTPEAHTTTWPVLAELNDARIQEIPITIGASRPEIWALFDTVIAQIDEGETVIFDITHGLRSIPFLAFLFAAYLKTAKQVTIEAIYYGAFELGDEGKGIPAPVIDLSEYVTMLDWITATDQFVQTGNANRLADLLGRGGSAKKASGKAAEKLKLVSQAAFLCQPVTLMEQAGSLGKALNLAAEDFSVTARPFNLLSERIVNAFDAFATSEDAEPLDILRAEYNMIHWYHQHGQLIQALSLAREWLIDAVTIRLGQPLDYHRTPRGLMERAVSGLALVGLEIYFDDLHGKREFTPADLNEYGRKIYDQWPEQASIARTWDQLSKVRNQLDHAEHQASRMRFSRIQSQAEEILKAMADLAKKWGIINLNLQEESGEITP